MSEILPPPLPPGPNRRAQNRWKKLLLAAALVVGGVPVLCVVIISGLKTFGLLRPYSIPTNGMAPAVQRGDQIYTEGLTYLVRRPRRGDIIVFKSDGLRGTARGSIYLKRVVGLPGEVMRLNKGVLTINRKPVELRNKSGVIHYFPVPFGHYLSDDWDEVTVPAASYFVIGDNSGDSADSRTWGFVPAKSVLGKVMFCYLPPARLGVVQ